MAVCARDLMRDDVITLSPELPLVEAQRVLVESDISGAPVVDESGRVVGVISASDLLRAVSEEHDTGLTQASYFRDVLPFSVSDWSRDVEDFQDRLEELSVADAMTKETVSVPPDASLRQVATTLCEHRVHRVLVVEGQRLLGIISSFDFVELFA
jgi:CBS domain-containing protein